MSVQQSCLLPRAQLRSFRATFASYQGVPRDSLPWEAFEEALEDDFNTPQALAVMHRWSSDWQVDLLRRALELFGLDAISRFKDAPLRVSSLAGDRERARKERNWEEADRLREQIEAHGWEMRDRPDGYDLVPKQ